MAQQHTDLDFKRDGENYIFIETLRTVMTADEAKLKMQQLRGQIIELTKQESQARLAIETRTLEAQAESAKVKIEALKDFESHCEKILKQPVQHQILKEG